MTDKTWRKAESDITWSDGNGKRYSCAKESYNKIYGEAVRRVHAAAVCKADNEEEDRPKDKSTIEREKRIDDIASADEEIKKKEDELHEKENAAVRSMSNAERDDLIQELRKELESLKKGKKAKSAKRLEHVGIDSSYSVLTYNMNSIERDGDKLLQSLGSTQ